ncbi:hypothetical protein [Winogradskyella sp.]|jgi:hypothetical protein|uniref:hypothetical protein n=1 Tax=Winogradskyella sp. TaxID=1883156 RepID=UPI0025D4E256|nr:hypothetical protein [Winogradskyella sp.]MCT4629540.1 hypothetical protein [Winogradskyella sp.]
MKKLINIFILIVLFSCEHKTNIEYFNDSKVFHYKTRNGINEPVLKNIIKYFSNENDVKLITKNDTIQVHGIHHTDKGRYGYFGAWVSTKEYFNKEIECEQKIIFNQYEFQYSFCYKDVIKHFDEQIKKSEKDVTYLVYAKRKDELLKYNQEIDRSLSKNSDEYIISDLIMNIPFSIYDKHEKKQILYVSSTNFQTGLLGSIGYEHFFFDKNKDTIASMSLVYVVH